MSTCRFTGARGREPRGGAADRAGAGPGEPAQGNAAVILTVPAQGAPAALKMPAQGAGVATLTVPAQGTMGDWTSPGSAAARPRCRQGVYSPLTLPRLLHRRERLGVVRGVAGQGKNGRRMWSLPQREAGP